MRNQYKIDSFFRPKAWPHFIESNSKTKSIVSRDGNQDEYGYDFLPTGRTHTLSETMRVQVWVFFSSAGNPLGTEN
jgi:hypothetical protein